VKRTNRTSNLRRIAARITASTAVLLLLSVGLVGFLQGCGVSFITALDAPVDLIASTDQAGQITLRWSAVANAHHYYLYRSLVESGPFGPSEAIPYRTLEGVSFVDINVPDGSYFYAVSAGDAFGGIESQLSNVARGTATLAPPEWGLPIIANVGIGLIDIAIDMFESDEPTYILTVPALPGAQLTVSRFEGNATLAQVGEPFGTVDGTVSGSAAIAVAGGTIYVASTDDLGLADNTAEMVLWRFDTDAGTWIAESASSSLLEAEASAPWIDFEARAADDFYLAYREKGNILNGPIAAYHYDGTTLTPMAATLVASGVDTVSNVRLSITPTAEVLVYEDASGSGEIVAATLTAGVWDTPTIISDTDDNIPAGYLDAVLDPVNDDLYVAYFDSTDGELVVKKNDVMTRLTPPLELVDSVAGSVALSARNGAVTIFYSEQPGDGSIRRFTGTAWEALGPDPLTTFGGALSSMNLGATSVGLVIGYVEGTVGFIRRSF
jgi:hypothetical protein